MYQFNYKRASSLEDASNLHDGASEPVFLAGGMTLIPSLKLRLAQPSDVIDLSAIGELTSMSASDGTLHVGAMVRHSQVASNESIPALAQLASGIGDKQVRNRGTIGGSLANNDPAADYPAAILGLGATVHTNRRTISGDAFFVDLFETALDDGEIITGVDFPIPKRAFYAKAPNPASRFAIVGVMVADTADGIRVGVTGAAACGFRLTSFESALNADCTSSALDGIEVDYSEFNDDLHASAAYRGNLVSVLAKRAVDNLS